MNNISSNLDHCGMIDNDFAFTERNFYGNIIKCALNTVQGIMQTLGVVTVEVRYAPSGSFTSHRLRLNESTERRDLLESLTVCGHAAKAAHFPQTPSVRPDGNRTRGLPLSVRSGTQPSGLTSQLSRA